MTIEDDDDRYAFEYGVVFFNKISARRDDSKRKTIKQQQSNNCLQI